MQLFPQVSDQFTPLSSGSSVLALLAALPSAWQPALPPAPEPGTALAQIPARGSLSASLQSVLGAGKRPQRFPHFLGFLHPQP